ncbi:helix-turn-helix domain-containing protein [Bacillus sp. FJAT-28004]|uniref:helix-turn-helix domain-containing protein n=1 Tax=Bacillus sp. FJAT-28004 TaxID=1679165 RepID=UPI0006B5619C|nr:AraC family transcriptional regulator [Bacillus sp. FJAT-28004]
MITFVYSGNVGKARCEPGWNWSPMGPLPDYDLWYAMEGKGKMTINSETFPISKGSCFLIRPGDAVSAVQDPDHRLTVIFVHFTVKNGQDFTPPSRHVQFEDTVMPGTCLQRIVDLQLREEERRSEEFDLLIKLVVLHMHRQEASMAQSSVSYMHKQLIHKVIDELRDHYGKEVTVARLANEVNVSPRYLSQLFLKYTGYPLREYIMRVRMERARFLLAETAMNITEVSYALGFTDIYHFSKMFKTHNGVPPSQFRYKGRPAQSHFGTSFLPPE